MASDQRIDLRAYDDTPAHVLFEVDPMKGTRDLIAAARAFACIG